MTKSSQAHVAPVQVPLPLPSTAGLARGSLEDHQAAYRRAFEAEGEGHAAGSHAEGLTGGRESAHGGRMGSCQCPILHLLDAHIHTCGLWDAPAAASLQTHTSQLTADDGGGSVLVSQHVPHEMVGPFHIGLSVEASCSSSYQTLKSQENYTSIDIIK